MLGNYFISFQDTIFIFKVLYQWTRHDDNFVKDKTTEAYNHEILQSFDKNGLFNRKNLLMVMQVRFKDLTKEYFREIYDFLNIFIYMSTQNISQRIILSLAKDPSIKFMHRRILEVKNS